MKMIDVSTKRTLFKMSIIALIMLVLAIVTVNAQDATGATVLLLPKTLCAEPNSCSLWPRLSENNYLYVLNREASVISVFKPNGSPYNQYDLSSLVADQKVTIKDFLPFSTDYLLIESPTGSNSLYRYDLSTRRLIAIEFHPSIFLTECGPNDARYHAEFFWLGPDKLLGCSLEQIHEGANRTFGIVVIDLATRSVTTIAHFQGSLETAPWLRVIGGQDGQVYMMPGYASIPQGLFDPIELKTQQIITHYDPQTSKWSVIRIPYALLPNTYDHLLDYVDVGSNMYFASYPIYQNSGQQFQVLKISHTGQVVWRATKNDLGFSGIPLTVTSDGRPIFWNLNNTSGSDVLKSNVSLPLSK